MRNMGKKTKCPSCKALVASDDPHRPFCSARCKDVDLGSWLQENYRISRPIGAWDLDRAVEEPKSEDLN